MALTIDIERKVGPAVVEEDPIKSDMDLLDTAHGTRSRPQLLQTSRQLDETGHKRRGDSTAQTVVLSIAVGADFRRLAFGVEFLGTGNMFGIPGSIGLFTLANGN